MTVDVNPRASNPGTISISNNSNSSSYPHSSYPYSTVDCDVVTQPWGTWTITANANSGYTFDHWVLTNAPDGFNTKSKTVSFPSDRIYSLTAFFVSGSTPPTTSAPSPPTNVNASDGNYTNQIRITWSASSGATSYRIYRSTSSSGGMYIDKTESTSYNDSNINCDGTRYYYSVRAENTGGLSDYSSYNSGYCDGGGGTEPPPAGEGVTPLSVNQAKAKIDETIELNILDVRASGSYENGHLLCAENAYWDSQFTRLDTSSELNAHKSMDLLIYDQDGSEAVAAANFLTGQGFSTVYYITGGFAAWDSAGYEVVSGTIPCNIPPMADAGPDQTVEGNTTVTLDGSGSDASSGTLSYSWTQISGPSAVGFTNKNTVSPTFTAPAVQNEQEMIFHLKVTNPSKASDTDSVSIFVTPASVVTNPPVADAGSDQTVNEKTLVTLNAGSSTPATGVTYAWTQTGGSPTVSLTQSSSSSPKATFTAPDVSATTVFTFKVTVTNADGSDSDTVQVTVNNLDNNTPDAPIANAGSDQSVNESTTVTLDGSGSYDPSGTITSYQWTQTAGTGTNVILSNSNTANPSFTAPSIDTSQVILTFQLVVTSTTGLSSPPDEVTITVNNVAGKPPVADAGNVQMAYGGQTVTLSGTGMDTDGTITSYQWMQISGPDVDDLLNDNTQTVSFTAPYLAETAILEFQLTVTDDQGLSDSDEVTVIVDTTPPPKADAGSDLTVKEGETVTLDGSNSSDTNGNGLAKYEWRQLSGTPVTLTPEDSSQVEFEAPTLQGSMEVLVFELTVEDDTGLTDRDVISVMVKSKSSSDNGFCFISSME